MHEEATITPKKIPDHMTIDSNSAEWWSSWSDWLKVAGFILGGIVTIVAVIGWAFSLKAGKLKDAASKAKESALERYKQESKLAIAEADAKAADANKIAATANERAAMLEERAAAARLETEKIKEKLTATAKLAEPTKLVIEQVIRNGDFDVLVVFKASKNDSLGNLSFKIAILDSPSVTIVKATPSLKISAYSAGDSPFEKAANGRSGILRYAPMGAGHAGFDISLTGPAIIEVSGSRLDEPCRIQIQ